MKNEQKSNGCESNRGILFFVLETISQWLRDGTTVTHSDASG